MDYKDYYTILGIERDADEQTIKSAFRRLARVYHPDVNPDKVGATEKFKEINEAYTVLSDADKRARYDLFSGRYEQYSYSSAGSAAPQARPQTQQRRTATRTLDEEDFERIMRGFARAYSAAAGRRAAGGSDFSDFFDALFGNLWNQNTAERANSPAPSPSADSAVNTDISLLEVLHGATRRLTYQDGRQVEVTIPAGIENGMRLRVAGQGERSFGRIRGDLYMTVRVQPHPAVERQGNDLHVRVTVPHEIAMRSGEISVPTLEQPATLKIPAGTRSGQQFRLRGLGLPSLQTPQARGDLIATVLVEPRAGAPFARDAHTAHPRKTPRASGKSTKPRAWLRQLLGGILAITGLLALAGQATWGSGSEWPLLAALAVMLLAHGISAPSRWAIVGSVFSFGGAVWLGSQLEITQWSTVLMQAWPLLPLAAGVVLLRSRRP